MSERWHYTESVGTTIARVLAFAIVLMLVLFSVDSFDMGDWPIVLPIAVVALGLVADGAIAWLGGARHRRELIAAVGATVLMWLAVLATGWLLEWCLSAVGASDTPSASVGVQLFLMSAAVVQVALFPRAQAIALWLLTSGATTFLLISVSANIFYGVGQPPTYIAAALAASSIGTLGLYVRSAISKRRGWKPLFWRLGLVVLAVAFSVGVSTFSTVYVGRGMVGYQSMDLLSLRRFYVLEVSRQLSSKYGENEFASATPALSSDLAQYAVLNNVGLTIYDRGASRVVTAVRQPIDGGGLAGDSNRFVPVSIGVTETAAIVEAINAGAFDVPEIIPVGVLPPLWEPLGLRTTRAAALASSSKTGTATSSAHVAPYPDGTRFALVATEPRSDWTEYPPLTVDEVSRTMGLMLAPWLFLSFMLPFTLGLLALDRRDAARARLAAVEERARLNRDVHDRVYNRLEALANRLAAWGSVDVSPPTPADEIRRTVSDLQGILGDGVAEPYPASADAAASLMADVCADQGRIWAMDVTLEGADALHEIDPRLGWELQCVAEEALTNAGRHGHAKRARVTLSVEDATLRLEIADSGSGIADPLGEDGLPPGAGGMRGMVERAQNLGGRLTVATGPDGTTVTVEVPLGRVG